MKALCIFCASSPEVDEKFKAAAYEIGRGCAQRGWRLLNGAGADGLMGASSDGCLEAGGEVVGVIPQWMIERGWLKDGLSRVVTTTDMAERKQWLRDNCDAVLVLPGGYGTMEEFFETLTQKQLGLFDRPIVLLDQDGFYRELVDWMVRCRRKCFLRRDSDLGLIDVATSVEGVFDILAKVG